jgi:hypothetical protein
MARVWRAERTRFAHLESDQALPLVDDQLEHRRILKLSLGLPEQEMSVAEPYAIDWAQHADSLRNWNVKLEA